MQDSIERELFVKASKEHVYEAITDPKQIIEWFPDAVQGELTAGEMPVFDFGSDGKVQLFIVAANPFDYFAYNWVPGSDGGATFYGDVRTIPHTLVEFIIEEVENGTKITLKESGFAALPESVAQEKLDMNTGGWKYMIDRLEKVLSE